MAALDISSVAIITGNGTGPILAKLFKRYLNEFAKNEDIDKVPYQDYFGPKDASHKMPKIFHSYQSLKTYLIENPVENARALSRREAEELLQAYKRWQQAGVNYVFRTSINAEALYLFRQLARAVKVFHFFTSVGNEVLIIRDQAEGFYANTDYSIYEEINEIGFVGKFTKQHQTDITRYALKLGENTFKQNYDIWSVYKFHLFGEHLENWIQEVDDQIRPLQPDTGLTQLLEYVKSEKKQERDLLVICSNEVGDIIFEPIIEALNIQAKLELYSRNVYLGLPIEKNGEISYITEYQTVHGSADDLFNENRLEDLVPYATIRIAALIAERYLKVPNLVSITEEAISRTKVLNLITRSEIEEEVFRFIKSRLDHS